MSDDEGGGAPARRRGRPVSLASRAAVVAAATALLQERGYAGFTVDEVARRCGVSKATIYRHWANGFELAAEAWGEQATDAVPVRATGDALADLGDQLVRLARFYASERGRVVAQLLAAGTVHPGGAALLRERFFAPRRRATLALIARGVADGQLRGDVDPELVVDMVFAPVVVRLFNGLAPIDDAGAAELTRLAAAALGRA
jgi:AcrR family transcriptional regulator